MHGHHDISIKILNIRGETINKPLESIFKQDLITGTFPSDCKSGNLVPAHKKILKTNKVFERILFINRFSFF